MRHDNRVKYVLFLGFALASPASAQDVADATPSRFATTAAAFSNCLKSAVQLGMMLKMDPVAFKAGLAQKCLGQQADFRVAGVQEAIRQGRTPDQAMQEIDGNIANARRIFAADQERYIVTGIVPH